MQQLTQYNIHCSGVPQRQHIPPGWVCYRCHPLHNMTPQITTHSLGSPGSPLPMLPEPHTQPYPSSSPHSQLHSCNTFPLTPFLLLPIPSPTHHTHYLTTPHAFLSFPTTHPTTQPTNTNHHKTKHTTTQHRRDHKQNKTTQTPPAATQFAHCSHPGH